MNERLKELAEQAGATVHKAMHGEAISFLENDLERFAELVRADERKACAELCDDVDTPDGWSTANLSASIRSRGNNGQD